MAPHQVSGPGTEPDINRKIIRTLSRTGDIPSRIPYGVVPPATRIDWYAGGYQK